MVPAIYDARNQPFQLTREAWRDCLEVAKLGGHSPNGFSGISRPEVKWFVRALRKALKEKRVTDPGLRDLVLSLVEFCEGQAGAGGFTTEVRLKRASPRLDREPPRVKRLHDAEKARSVIHRRVGACTFVPRPDEPTF